MLGRRIQNELKYANVVLPADEISTIGYHAKCYRKFTAVSAKVLTDNRHGEMIAPKSPVSTRSTAAHNLTSPDERVFNKVCLFCEKEFKKIKNVRHRLSKCDMKESFETELLKTPSQCCLHAGEGAASGKILKFTKDLLSKCYLVHFLRNRISTRSARFIIPENVNFIEGFHQRCLKSYFEINDDLKSSSPFESCIKMYAMVLEDHTMLKKVRGIDFLAKEVWYHPVCRSLYQSPADFIVKKANTDNIDSTWHETRRVHADAFAQIVDIVETSIVQQGNVHLMSELRSLYRSLLDEWNIDEDLTFTTQHLEEKLIKQFGPIISFDTGNKKKGNIVFKTGMAIDRVTRAAFDTRRQLDVETRDAAFRLRKEILDSKKSPLGEEMTVEDILKGEINAPESLVGFLKHLIQGPDVRRGKTETKERRIKSISQDLVFAAGGGRWKPRKHMMLGLAMKKLTSSRKVIDLLNRHGHCINYNCIEELETELTMQLHDNERLTPFGMQTRPNLLLGVAWDNYDRFVCTLTGKNTLHDTVGIVYQDLEEGSMGESATDTNSMNDESSADDVGGTTPFGFPKSLGFKRRRMYESHGLHLEPYRKKPKMSNALLLKSDDPLRSQIPESYATAKLKDQLWMMILRFVPGTAMWIGWNSVFSISKERNKKQGVWYLPQINASPTSFTVIAETLKRSIKLADESGRHTISVSCDLAVAKLMLRIQKEESPKYDRAFINFGAFHIKMAFFNAIGKYIDLSGGPNLLSIAGLIASDSLKGFIKGTNFNRCKRIHPLLYVALGLLHFEAFLESSKTDIEMVKADLTILQSNITSEKNIKQVPEGILDLCRSYSAYVEETKSGEHGATARYWMQYMNMIELHHDLSRSVREGDFELFVYTLPKVSAYFFIFNQPNYARWMVLYHSNLLKLNETHPEVYQDFLKGGFGVKRTDKNFSRSPVDLTLEQTINADAASQRTGIAAFTNSIAARQRWAQSHFISMSVITHLMEEMGLTRKDDVTQELKKSRIKRNNEDIDKLLMAISSSMNPFTIDPFNIESLFNIETGKATSKETCDFMLNITTEGVKQQNSFINKCVSDTNLFNASITRNKLRTFALEGAKVKRKSSKGKLEEVKMEKNLFGKLLCLALQQKIDLKEILCYPLTPLPVSLCHFDGTLRSTPKSQLMKYLKIQIVSSSPTSIDLYIVDGNFYLHLLKDLPCTFGKISQTIFYGLCNISVSQRIDVVFDRYVTPSIKDYERETRADGETNRPYVISGPDQKRPHDFLKALRNNNFKTALVRYLVHSWHDDALVNILGTKTLFVTCDDKCFSFNVVNNAMAKHEIVSMKSGAEEADYRMLFHAASFPSPANIVIRTVDTDVLCITLGIRKYLPVDSHIWLEIGHYSDNTLEFVDTDAIYGFLGEKMSDALPALHVFTGSDYTPSFYKKGKIRPLQLLRKHEDIQVAFASLGSSEDINCNTKELIEKFVCLMYSQPKRVVQVSDARFNHFMKSYKLKNDNFESIKGCDASSMPLSLPSLRQKIKRTNRIMSIWKSAHLPDASGFDTTGNGWNLIDGKYEFHWFDGEPYPSVESISYSAVAFDDEEEEVVEDLLFQSESDSDSGADSD